MRRKCADTNQMNSGFQRQDNVDRLRIKNHSRHYYLGQAAFYLRQGNENEVLLNMQVVERLQIEIDDLLTSITRNYYPILERLWWSQ